MLTLHQIAPAYVCQMWPDARPLLAEALKYAGGEYNVDQLQFMLVRGEQILLVAADEERKVHGAATVQFIAYPAKRVAFVTAISGRMITTESLWQQLQAWCREHGATAVQGAARESIARLWKQKFGFEQRYIIVEHGL